MTAALAKEQSYQYGIKILNGPLKGKSFKIVSAQLTIGRSKENDIALPDDKRISRQHAQIVFENQGISIYELSNNDRMSVNGQKTKHALLQNSSIITVGDTKLQFIIKTPSSKGGLAKPGVSRNYNNLAKRNNNNGSMGFYIIIGVVALLVGLLMMDGNKKKKGLLSEINENKIELDVENNKKLIDAYNKQKKYFGKKGKLYRQAQASYLKGFREYEHGLYHRALNAFQACLAIDPKHLLCNRYKNLSIRKFNELVQYKMLIARQYKDQNQFSACKKTYENIMFMVQDSTSKIYKEAKDNYNVCNTMLKGQF